METTKIIKLNHPIKTDKKEISEVELAIPLVKHMKVMDTANGEMAKQIAMLSALTGLSTSIIELLHISDFQLLKNEVDSFLKIPS